MTRRADARAISVRVALTATVYRLNLTLSDVERGVYEKLELRLARHPSESARYFWLRTIAYCLSYEEGIAFSKGGSPTVRSPQSRSLTRLESS